MNNDEISILNQEGYDLMAAAFEVYNELGNGFTEDIYQEALETELATRGIPYASQVPVLIYYKARPLKKTFKPDLITHDQIVVELKAHKTLLPEHEAQLINYLKAMRKPIGYLINFGSPGKLQWQRIIRTPETNQK